MNRNSKPTARVLAACLAATLLAVPVASADSSGIDAPTTDTSSPQSSVVPKETPKVMPTQKLFEFLAAYFSNAKAADVNGDGALNEKDIFHFLNGYLKGRA